MYRISHYVILSVYLFLFLALTVMAAWATFGTAALPPPGHDDFVEVVKAFEDKAVGEHYKAEMEVVRDRQKRFGEIAFSGLATVLGALIGFLSASWGNSSAAAGMQLPNRHTAAVSEKAADGKDPGPDSPT